jgi:DNA-directed RNA polymerase specialized sigma24 family protein
MASIPPGNGKQLNFKNLSDLDLVRVIAADPRNNLTFKEFIARFETRIQFYISKTCRLLNYAAGLEKIEDLTQEVYEALLDKNCAKLKKINKNVSAYLIEMANNTVRNDRRKFFARKRRPAGGFESFDKKIFEWSLSDGRRLQLEAITWPDDRLYELIDAIDRCLDRILQHNRKKERNRLIIKYYLFEDLEPADIALQRWMDLSPKRIENLIGAMMGTLRKCLQRKE